MNNSAGNMFSILVLAIRHRASIFLKGPLKPVCMQSVSKRFLRNMETTMETENIRPSVSPASKRICKDITNTNNVVIDNNTNNSVEENKTLQFTKLNADAFEPYRGSKASAGLDLKSCEECVVKAKSSLLVNTGLAITVPEGTYGRVAPRSGLAVKHSIDVGAGVIDRDYTGEVRVLLFNFGENDFPIKKGDRICQLICEKICIPDVVECTKLKDTERGSKGFGSSGTN